MNKPINVNGVDVSECCCYESQRCLWSKKYYEIIPVPLCKEIKDCYYKQLQRLKAENERLKRLINTHLTTFDKCCVNGLIMNEVLEDEIHN